MTKVRTNLGKVATTPKGEYNSATTYVKLDIVSYNGSSYVCLQESVGNLPTDTEYWQLIASKGDTGAKGQDGYTPIKGVDYFTQEDIASLNIPSKTSDITNDSGFITKSVNDLVNYYLKSETYTKEEVNTIIGNIQQFHYEVVQQLPATGENNIMYLVPKSTSQTNNYYDEYVYSNGWEKIGDTEIDLSNYVTITMLNQALADYTTTANLTTLLAEKQNIMQFSVMPTANANTVGKIVQYTGTTDSTYTNGYFYIGKSNGQVPATYSWENINVQAGGEIPSELKVYCIEENNSSTKSLVLEDIPTGIYMFSQERTDTTSGYNKTFNMYIKLNSSSNAVYTQIGTNDIFVYNKHISTIDTTSSTAQKIGFIGSIPRYVGTPTTGILVQNIDVKVQSGSIIFSNTDKVLNTVLVETRQTISGKKTFTTLPESSVMPTTDNQFVNKKYVDDQIATVGIEIIDATDVDTFFEAFTNAQNDGNTSVASLYMENFGENEDYSGWVEFNFNAENSANYVFGSKTGLIAFEDDGEGNISIVYDEEDILTTKSYVDSVSSKQVFSIDRDVIYNASNPLPVETLKSGIYDLNNRTQGGFAIKQATTQKIVNTYDYIVPIYMVVVKTYDEAINEVRQTQSNCYFATLLGMDKNTFSVQRYYLYIDTNEELNAFTSAYSTNIYFLSNNQQAIYGKKNFNNIPSSSGTPTYDYDLVTKRYVDNQIGNINTILATLTTPSGNGGN